MTTFRAALLCGLLLCAGCGEQPAASAAKQILWVQFFDVPIAEECRAGFVAGLPATGLRAGTDYVLTCKSAQGDIGALNTLLAGARDARPDVIVTSSTPAMQAAISHIRDIPVVAINADPCGAGMGRSDTDHLPNFTGVALIGDCAGMAALIREIMPSTRRVGTVFSPAEDNSVLCREQFAAALAVQGMELLAQPAPTALEVPEAARALVMERPDLICQLADNASATAFPAVAAAARAARLPLFAFASDQAAQGAVLTYSRDCVDAGRMAAELAARILRGGQPRDLPVARNSRSLLIVNRRAAAGCGLMLPPAVLDRADTVLL